METTMKLGMIIEKGTLEQMQKEYDALLEKAKVGYGDLVSEAEGDVLGTFRIQTDNIKITFSLSKYFGSDYAVYQVFE